MNDEDFAMVEAMERYGGSFVKSLAQCFYTADKSNFSKLKKAFPEYCEQYREMAKR